MPRLVARDRFSYAQRQLAAGDEFDASEADAVLLRAVGKASDPMPEPVPTAVEEPGKFLQEQNYKISALKKRKPKGGRYARRDMRAEE